MLIDECYECGFMGEFDCISKGFVCLWCGNYELIKVLVMCWVCGYLGSLDVCLFNVGK